MSLQSLIKLYVSHVCESEISTTQWYLGDGHPKYDNLTKWVLIISLQKPPECSKCRNHGLWQRLKDHKRHCRYKSCYCEKCSLNQKRKNIQAEIKQYYHINIIIYILIGATFIYLYISQIYLWSIYLPKDPNSNIILDVSLDYGIV